MAHILRLTQGGSTVFDFLDTAKIKLVAYNPDLESRGTTATDSAVFTLVGSSADAPNDTLVILDRVLANAADNAAARKSGLSYTPIFLEVQSNGATRLVRSEVWGGDIQKPAWFTRFLQRNAVLNIGLSLVRRNHTEETSPVTLHNAVSVSNHFGALTLSGLRGDIPCPIKLVVRAGGSFVDEVIAGMRTRPNLANFNIAVVEAESYSDSVGAAVAYSVDANMSPGSGNTGFRWTPAATTETWLVRYVFTTNVSDLFGRYRLLCRNRDNSGSVKFSLRGRSGIIMGSSLQYGSYTMDAPVPVNHVGGTTFFNLTDLGVLNIPGVYTGGQTVSGVFFELYGKASSTGAGITLDVDCFYLVPCDEVDGSGAVMAQYVAYLGGGGIAPDAGIDANDRVPAFSLITDTGAYGLGAKNAAGGPLRAFPGRTQKLYLLGLDGSNTSHGWNATNAVTVIYTPWYKWTPESTA